MTLVAWSVDRKSDRHAGAFSLWQDASVLVGWWIDKPLGSIRKKP